MTAIIKTTPRNCQVNIGEFIGNSQAFIVMETATFSTMQQAEKWIGGGRWDIEKEKRIYVHDKDKSQVFENHCKHG